MNSSALKKNRADLLLNFYSSNRLPVILQTEVAECGLACLAMIAGFYGFDTDLMHLRNRFSISSKGVSLKNIMDIAVRMHLTPRALRVELEELKQVQLPCVIHWGLHHFIVLKEIRKDKLVVHDPAFGERTLDYKNFDNNFTGVVLELTPTREFRRGEEKKDIRISDFWSSTLGLKRSLSQILLLSFLLQLFGLLSPLYMQTVVDDVLLRKDTDLLLVISLGFGLLMLINIATNSLREFVIMQVSTKMTMQMCANLFHHLVRLPMVYFEKRHMGDIVSRFGSLGRIRDLLTHSLVAAVIDGLMAILTLVAMMIYSVKLTIISVFVVLLYAFIRWIFFRPLKILSEESLIAAAKESSYFMESVRAIQTIKLFQREQTRQNQWQNFLAGSINKHIRIARWDISYNAINGVLWGTGNLFITYLAAKLVIDNSLSLGMLYAFLSFKGSFEGAMGGLISKWIEFKMLDLHLNRISDIAFTETEKIDLHENHDEVSGLNNNQSACVSYSPANRIGGKIEVRKLSYRYAEHEPYVFENLNFIIYPGETVAITGPSGCGKTTLMKCLMGLIEPTEGQILIDDIPLKSTRQYRSQIAAVMQEDQLLSGDVIENISCFSPVVDMERIFEVSKMACIHNEIMKMPMQYSTLVGDMGSNLSGGQKQRIILARALYRNPRILFMDEATSHLDIENEFNVNEHIKNLDISRVLIAHRPETVRSAGRRIKLTSHGEE